MIVDELWRPVPGYEGAYAVSNRGRVRSITRKVRCCGGGLRTVTERVLSHYLNEHGYPCVALRRDGGLKTYSIHRLVARAFLGEPSSRQVVRHLNGNPSDNRLLNLRWGTYAENGADMARHGRSWGARTHCRYNHEFTVDNTYRNPHGARVCRQCRRDQTIRRAALRTTLADGTVTTQLVPQPALDGQ